MTFISVVLNIQLLWKFKCLGDFFEFCIPAEICHIEPWGHSFWTFLKFGSDFDLAQDFPCSVKTVECGQIFILACRQFRKRVSIILKKQGPDADPEGGRTPTPFCAKFFKNSSKLAKIC